jgi:type III secretion system low calcium response chaperone LcrH/SycD
MEEEKENKYAINWDAPVSPEFFEKIGQNGVYPQQLFKVNDETLSKYYAAAKSLIDDKNWVEARDSFLFLTFLNPTYPSFWIGLGFSEQSQANYKEAVEAYSRAQALDPSNPVAYANAFQCYLALGDQTKADLMFEKAVQFCTDTPEHNEIQSKLKDVKQNFKPQAKM